MIGETTVSEDLKRALHEYYEQHGIAVKSFGCSHSLKCEQAAAPELLKGRGSEAYVGSRYQDDRFRIVVVSLDRGEGACDVWDRQSEIENLPSDGKGLNPHMAGTLLTLRAILCEHSRADIWTQFAMINAAKCCYGNMYTVPDPLYWECSEFGFGELSLLKPKIVVTQGKNAREPVKLRQSPMSDRAGHMADQYLSGCRKPELLGSIEWVIAKHIHEIALGDQRCYWLETPHPSDRGGRWHPFGNVFLPVLGRILHDLVIGSVGA